MTMHQRLLAGLLALFAFGLGQAAAAEPVRIAVPTWVGFGPLFIAQEKGFFKKHGVEVVLVPSDNAQQHYPLLLAGKYDIIAGGVGSSMLYIKSADDVQYVTILDDSFGGDGVVAKRDITTLAELKGKSIAVNVASISEFYLNYLLRQAGLSEKDVTVVDLAPGEAGKAFMDGRVDVAVTWEPFLTRAKQTDFGHLLTDSTATPGLLCDALVANKRFVKERPAEVRAVVAAWNEAVVYYGEHPTEANAIMAHGLGGWLKDPDVIAETMQKVRFYGAEDSRAMFGTAEKPGPLYATVKEALGIWSSLGRVKTKVAPEDVLNYAFVGS